MPSLGRKVADAVLGKNSIRKFLVSDQKSAWVEHKGYKLYLRKSERLLSPGSAMRWPTIDVGQIQRIDGGTYKTLPAKERKRGKLKEVLQDIEDAGAEIGISNTYVEQVRNEFLGSALQRYGFRPAEVSGENSYVRDGYQQSMNRWHDKHNKGYRSKD